MRSRRKKIGCPKKAAAGDTARLEGVSLLLMRSFGVSGGILYSLTKNSHFAYRELVYQDVIQGQTDPEMTVSGEHLLFLINRLLARFESAAPAAEESAEPLTAEQEKQLVLVEEINIQLEALAISDTSARVTDEGVTISLSNIQFLANSAELPESEKKKLREISQILKTIPQRKILISGHTALAGTEQDRMKTSLERAQAVANYLVSLGTRKAEEFEVRGYGSQRPVADNKTLQGMALNRRVEFTIVGDQP